MCKIITLLYIKSEEFKYTDQTSHHFLSKYIPLIQAVFPYFIYFNFTSRLIHLSQRCSNIPQSFLQVLPISEQTSVTTVANVSLEGYRRPQRYISRQLDQGSRQIYQECEQVKLEQRDLTILIQQLISGSQQRGFITLKPSCFFNFWLPQITDILKNYLM